MAYTILISSAAPIDLLVGQLTTRIKQDNRFRFQVGRLGTSFFGLGKNAEGPRQFFTLKNIRLLRKKEYCGNHFGPCLVLDRKKPTSSYLECSDWIEFNNLINEFLDSISYDSEVYSEPRDVKGKFWIRKANKPRTRYDFEYKYSSGRAVPEPNKGTADQFI